MEGITASCPDPCGAGTTRAALGAGPGPLTEGAAQHLPCSTHCTMGLSGRHLGTKFLLFIRAYFVCTYLYVLT